MKRLKPYDVVLLAPPLWRSSLRQIACQVVAIDGREAALEPLDPDDLDSLPVALPDMFMTFTHGGSLVALKGDLILKSALRTGAEAVRNYDVRFRVTDGVHTPAGPPRLPLCAPVVLRRLGDGGKQLSDEPIHGQSIQITPDCLQVEPLSEPVSVGESVSVELSLPGTQRPIQCLATVASTGAESVLLEYQHITRAERGRLVTFIFDCHREALKLYRAEQRLLV